MQKSPLCDLAMYCASSVYVYCANERGSLTPIDRGNLQVIIQAMDAIGRKHEISRAFLHQACLDVERNNLASDIRLPNLKGYRNLFAEFSANDSLMTRIAVAKRFKPPRKLSDWVAPDKPFDRSGQLLLKDVQSELGSTLQGTDTAPGDEPATPCFRAMLGAVTRNVRPNRRRGANTVARPATVTATVGEDADIQIGGTKDRHNQKRRRFSPSPGPEEALNLERLCSNGMAGRGRGTAVGGNAFSPPRAMSGGSGSSTYHHYGRYPAQHANVSAVLPDRTGSSTSSSPMNHISTGTDTRTQSSQASPDVMGFAGLGNTAEENRVDLRSLQDRVATPIWDQAILDSMNDVPLPVNYGGDPWGIMNADLDWDAQVTTG